MQRMQIELLVALAGLKRIVDRCTLLLIASAFESVWQIDRQCFRKVV